MRRNKAFLAFVLILSALIASELSCKSNDSEDSEFQFDDDQTAGFDPSPGEVNNEGDDDSGDSAFTWIPIPGGEFKMGCVPQDEQCNDDETPAHTVSISDFEMTETEITQRQFENEMGYNPSGHGDCADCPVERVTWGVAGAFCEAVGGRLPTEAEWEYAARSGKNAIYICGDDSACLLDIAWFKSNSGMKTQPVKGKYPNDFGLYDMAGNVWEWCSDRYKVDYYENSPKNNPQGPDNGVKRVLRGGSFERTAEVLRASDRDWAFPNVEDFNDGFRCVRDPQSD